MGFMTTDVEELRKRWMKLYLNIMALKSTNPKKTELLQSFHEKAAVFNSEIMELLDGLKQ